jgi:hypothetical protein
MLHNLFTRQTCCFVAMIAFALHKIRICSIELEFSEYTNQLVCLRRARQWFVQSRIRTSQCKTRTTMTLSFCKWQFAKGLSPQLNTCQNRTLLKHYSYFNFVMFKKCVDHWMQRFSKTYKKLCVFLCDPELKSLKAASAASNRHEQPHACLQWDAFLNATCCNLNEEL